MINQYVDNIEKRYFDEDGIKVESFFEGSQIENFIDLVFEAHGQYEIKNRALALIENNDLRVNVDYNPLLNYVDYHDNMMGLVNALYPCMYALGEYDYIKKEEYTFQKPRIFIVNWQRDDWVK